MAGDLSANAPTKAKFVNGLKAYIEEAYPGSAVRKVPAGYAIRFDGAESDPDIVIGINTNAEIRAAVARMPARKPKSGK